MTTLDYRKNMDVEVELDFDESDGTVSVVCKSNDGIFIVECGKDGKLAIDAFNHPFAFRDREEKVTTPDDFYGWHYDNAIDAYIKEA